MAANADKRYLLRLKPVTHEFAPHNFKVANFNYFFLCSKTLCATLANLSEYGGHFSLTVYLLALPHIPHSSASTSPAGW